MEGAGLAALLQLVFGVGVPVLGLVIFYSIGHGVEKRHIRNLEQREARLGHILCTNLRKIPPNWRISRAEYVDGQAVIGSDAFKTWAGGIRGIFGGEMRALETLMDRARREAILRLKEQAALQGANVVWNLRLETSDIARGQGAGKGMPAAEVHAYATALRVEGGK